MQEKTVKIPGPDHPIAIETSPQRIVVTRAGQFIADSVRALTLREAAYRAVYYIPREDTDMELLQRSAHTTYCPYKGDCAYFSIPAAGEAGVNAAWSYEAPYASVAAIKGYIAFYPDQVESIALLPG